MRGAGAGVSEHDLIVLAIRLITEASRDDKNPFHHSFVGDKYTISQHEGWALSSVNDRVARNDPTGPDGIYTSQVGISLGKSKALEALPRGRSLL